MHACIWVIEQGQVRDLEGVVQSLYCCTIARIHSVVCKVLLSEV